MHPAAKMCWTCGHDVAATNQSTPADISELLRAHASPPTHADVGESLRAHASQPVVPGSNVDAVDQIPLVEWKDESDQPVVSALPPVTAPPAPTVQAREAVPARQPRNWSMALVGGAGVLACVAALVVVQSLQPAASPQPVSSAPPPAAAPAGAEEPILEGPVPTWVGSRQATWANDGSKTISFELQSTRDVNVWMARVRPLLIVRCLYRTTEVFVATQASASIEGQSGSHTVRLTIDNEPELLQQWTDSVSGHELFAPNGVDLARRIARAELVRFSFTPYNAKPVTADFVVSGFDQLAGLVGNTCGWKVNDSVPTRTARR
jgi:hypothetical protein